MGWRDLLRIGAPGIPKRRALEDEAGRALTQPVYRFGAFRQGISATEQQPTASRLLTDGFSGMQAIASKAIANRLSDLDFVVQEQSRIEVGTLKWENNDEHPLLLPLQRPNPLLSGSQLLKLTSYWINLTGEAFWLIVTNGAGAIREFWPMSPRNIEKLAGTSSPVTGFVFHGEAGETHYGLEEVVWMFDPDPANPFQGVGVVGPQARDFDSATFAADTVRSHYQNDAIPKTVLKATAEATPPTKEIRDLFYDDWRNRYSKRGGQDSGLPAFLPSGFDIQEIAAGSNLDESRGMMEYLRNNLLMASGVPRSILGDVVDVNRAAADTNKLVFDRNTIKPQARLITDALTFQVAQPFYGLKARIRFDEFIDEDAELRLAQEAQDLALKVRSINQVREDRGLDSVEWGDAPVGTFADVPYTGDEKEPADPFGNPFGEPDTEPEPEDDPENGTPEQDEIELAEEPDEAGRALIFARASRRISRNFTPERAFGRAMQVESLYVPRMVANLRRVFAGQKALTLDALAKDPDAFRSLIEGGHGRADFVDELFELEDFSRLFDVLVTPIREDVFRRSAENVLLGLEVGPSLVFNQEAILTMRAQGAELVTLANATTKRLIRNTLAKGLEGGENAEKMASRVRSVYNVASKSRSRTIARTEVGHAISSGQLAGYIESKVVEKKQWNTARDARVRDTHTMDGVQVLLHEPFTLLDGEQALVPRVAVGGGRLSAHNGINCRCFDTPVVEGG